MFKKRTARSHRTKVSAITTISPASSSDEEDTPQTTAKQRKLTSASKSLLSSQSHPNRLKLSSNPDLLPEKTVYSSTGTLMSKQAIMDDATRVDPLQDPDLKAHSNPNPTREPDYTTRLIKRPHPNSKASAGPIRASNSIRITCRFDYQPAICKDYKQTGFCGYGDGCIFMHDRGDYKSGWQLDQEWEEKQRNGGKEPEPEGLEVREVREVEELPFACLICRGDFKNPIMTKCGHYFCEACALGQYKKTAKCFACNGPTSGIFNAAAKLVRKLKERKEGVKGKDFGGGDETDSGGEMGVRKIEKGAKENDGGEEEEEED